MVVWHGRGDRRERMVPVGIVAGIAGTPANHAGGVDVDGAYLRRGISHIRRVAGLQPDFTEDLNSCAP